MDGGFLPEPRPVSESKEVDGKTLVKLSTSDETLCLAATSSARGLNPFKHCQFWKMLKSKMGGMPEDAGELDPMLSTLQGPTASPESARPAQRARKKPRHNPAIELGAIQIEVPEKFGSDVTRLISVSEVVQKSRSGAKGVFIDLADLPWAVTYLHDEYMYAGVPGAAESSDSPLPEAALGLDFVSKLSTWVFRFEDEKNEVQVREFIVPRRKRPDDGEGGLRTLEPDEYELEKERVKGVALKWASGVGGAHGDAAAVPTPESWVGV
jgi:hypothetical protein